ncbi:MAG: methyltransferase FkbM [Ignavibacteria bacterium]|nr:MAG: methyltransferase FkbM [Ignavibacteria bacterium]KAF0158540.1 MAG: methyltransferase FkbM [Ignavibacteria bacterium]
MINFTLLKIPRPKLSFEKDKPIALYGAGNLGKEFCQFLKKEGYNNIFFIDKKIKQLTTCENISIYPPEYPIEKTTPIIITIFNRDVNINQIVKELEVIGFVNVFTILDISSLFKKKFFTSRFWITAREYYNGKEAEINNCFHLFKDIKSKNIYKSIIESRLSADFQFMPKKETNQYFPNDIPKWNEPINLIDCGAYDGDTIYDIINYNYKYKYKFESIICFEPDSINFTRLKKNSFGFSNSLPNTRLMILPLGLWSDSKKIFFSCNEGESSHVVLNSDSKDYIQCIALDEIFINHSTSLIKMDIEGAEIEAINGSQKLIKKYKPGLAISVYHRADHLWEIPKLINDLDQNYDFYLRCHGFNGLETILYALPK